MDELTMHKRMVWLDTAKHDLEDVLRDLLHAAGGDREYVREAIDEALAAIDADEQRIRDARVAAAEASIQARLDAGPPTITEGSDSDGT